MVKVSTTNEERRREQGAPPEKYELTTRNRRALVVRTGIRAGAQIRGFKVEIDGAGGQEVDT